ncbi:MAG: biotin/lipoyl-binding protein [Marinilabiliales bacterium]|nr:biotin/lipoyl-binding protein [Marinilabiliales bacterium]
MLFYMAFFTDRTSTYKVEKDKLIIETVIEDQFNDYITVPGTVEPISMIFLDAQEGGRVEEILIEEGSMVKKGDIILRLSATPISTLISSTARPSLPKRRTS